MDVWHKNYNFLLHSSLYPSSRSFLISIQSFSFDPFRDVCQLVCMVCYGFQHCFCYMAAASVSIQIFLQFLSTYAPHNILSRPLAAFPHCHHENQRLMNVIQVTIINITKKFAETRIKPATPLFSSPAC